MQLTTVKTLIDTQAVNISLIDASGVIYCDTGIVETAAESIKALQEVGPAFVVTNNSYHGPSHIVENLQGFGIHFNESDIFSSGFGLHLDETIRALLPEKKVFIFGCDLTMPYFKMSDISDITTDLAHADIVILMSTGDGLNRDLSHEIIAEKRKRPALEIVCCNPDLFVRGYGMDRFPVIGAEASFIQDALGEPIHWFGKPYANYYYALRDWLNEKHGLIVDDKTVFFDDNINNVRAMQHYIGATGCCITETGIYHLMDQTPCFEELNGIEPVYQAKQLS